MTLKSLEAHSALVYSLNLQVMTPASYRITSASLVELVSSVFSLHSVNSSHLQLILSFI